MTGQNTYNKLTTHAQEVLDRIGYPDAVPPELRDSQIIETHISVLLIGAAYVLKLKKCVAFPFVDHTEVSQRWKSAVNEVVLNRRLSNDIYLGVIAVSRDTPLSIADCVDVTLQSPIPAELLEVGVLMKTIDQAGVLSTLIAQDQATVEKHIFPLAKRIAEFHKAQLATHTASSSPIVDIAQLARDNISILQENAADYLTPTQQTLIKNIANFTEKSLEKNQQLLRQRHSMGLVIDGHGDLRAEHVCYSDNEVSVIDCIEFNDEIRRVDILNDIAFLRMDLDYLKQGRLANALIAYYRQQLGEPADNAALLDFYSTYRAMVRAKIQLLRVIELQSSQKNGLKQQTTAEQQKIAKYISLAHRYTLSITSPCLIAIGGLMGVGKSTLAQWLAEQTYATLLSSDVVRKQLYGSDAGDKSLDFGAKKYAKEATEHTYQQLFQIASQELSKGNPVIVDSSFIKHHHRRAIIEIAEMTGVGVVFIWCELDEQTQMQRLKARSASGTAISDGRIELASQQRESFEAFTTEEKSGILKVDTTSMPNLATLKTICQNLKG